MTDRLHRPVVVGVDHTPKSQLALRWAVEEAGYRRLPLRIVHVYEWPPYTAPPSTQFPEPRPAAVRADPNYDVVDRAVAYARDRLGGDAVSAKLVQGRATPAMLDEAAEARLVVVGSRGRTAIASAVLGSVSAALTAHARCPVVVVRAPEPGTVEGSGVVVGVDGSEHSERAVAFAFEEAAQRRVPLFAYYCWQPDRSLERWMTAIPSDQSDRVRWLAESLAGFGEKYPDVEVTAKVLEGHPASVLVMQSLGAHLLVVGSRGTGGIAGLLLGSVSQSVLHHAYSPVAVIKEDD